ncbi:hypothetical protein ANN_07704 [Periplaneta americana]|uniref:RNase H type-1 domain-containing protein n=1 Tax=Periplaneta americana TaxID=6978 RepID=A0ABQ8T0Y0_PERAM|nr:hypothetical protein ANN_07704 [Periplaneta americana]
MCCYDWWLGFNGGGCGWESSIGRSTAVFKGLSFVFMTSMGVAGGGALDRIILEMAHVQTSHAAPVIVTWIYFRVHIPDQIKKFPSCSGYTSCIYKASESTVNEVISKKRNAFLVSQASGLIFISSVGPPLHTLMYNCGCKMADEREQGAGAGVTCCLFSLYRSLEYGTTSFDGEITAISESLRNLLCYINKFKNAVILSDSKAAILSIVSRNTPSSQTAKITKMLSQYHSIKELYSNGYHPIVESWGTRIRFVCNCGRHLQWSGIRGRKTLLGVPEATDPVSGCAGVFIVRLATTGLLSTSRTINKPAQPDTGSVASAEHKEKKELVGSLADKKLPTEECTGRKGDREKSSVQKKI